MGMHARNQKSSHVRRLRQLTGGAESTTVGLADALFTTTQQRVLGLLFGQPERSFFATELIELTGSGSGAVQRELQRLAASGLVTVTRIGNQKHFQANRASPVFDELCSLVIKTVGLADPIRKAIAPLAEKIDLVLLYGSVPKGTDTANSDIDLLVVADEVTLEDLYAVLAAVETSLDRKINPTLYTAKEFAQRRNAGNAFLTRVLTGKHTVLFGDERGTFATR
jgi:predicted nucleotidyltransferase